MARDREETAIARTRQPRARRLLCRASALRRRWPAFAAGSAVLALAVVSACDLAMLNTQPPSTPHSIEISPADTLVNEGDQARFVITVRDEQGEEMDGPPAWAPVRWHPTVPSAISIEDDGTFTALEGGELRVLARLAGLEAWVDLRFNPAFVELSTDNWYITQAAQNLSRTVPIVAGRDAFLRVFPTGHTTSYYEPDARAMFYMDGEMIHQVQLSTVEEKIPDRPIEGTLAHSNDGMIPGWVLQPGVEMVVEVNVNGATPLAPGSSIRIPEGDGRERLNVIRMPVYQQIIVPTIQSRWDGSEAIVDWVSRQDLESPFFTHLRNVLPINEIEVTFHDPVRTDADITTGAGWNRWLSETTILWRLEGETGYYYGTSPLPPGSAYGGLAWLQLPVGVGVNRPGTYAHEVGHNMNLSHTNCPTGDNAPGGVDPAFPYQNGSIGIYGVYVGRQGILDPAEWKDHMSYCNPEWTSDYSFQRALYRRLNTERDEVRAGRRAVPEESTLMIWGHAVGGEIVLEPAFLVQAKPSLPSGQGPYRVEALGPNGEPRFSHAFTPVELEYGGGGFNFTIPYDPERDGPIERIVVAGPEGEAAMGPSDRSPLAIMIDDATGQVRGFARDWTGPASQTGGIRVLVSEGIPWSVR